MSSPSQEEGPSAYDLLVNSLRPGKRAKLERGAKGVGEMVEGGAERTEGVAVEASEDAEEYDVESASGEESEEEGNSNPGRGAGEVAVRCGGLC